MIRRNFLGQEIHKMKYTKICELPELLDFSILKFDKAIDTSLLERIQIESKYELVRLSKLMILEYGKNLPEIDRIDGDYPVMGSNGRVGWHNSYIVAGPAVIIGRKGSAGQIVWEEHNCNPIDTTFYLSLLTNKYSLKFAYYLLIAIDLRQIPKMKRSTGVPGLSRKDVYSLMLPLVPNTMQEEIICKCDGEKSQFETIRMKTDDFYKEIKRIFVENNIFSISNDI